MTDRSSEDTEQSGVPQRPLTRRSVVIGTTELTWSLLLRQRSGWIRKLVEQALNLDICGGTGKNRTYDLSIIREVRRIRRIPMRAEPSHSVQVR
jgi:hypothetical protein